MALSPSHYEVLGVPTDAALEVIRVAFKRRALVAHPDKGGTEEAFHAVYRALDVLTDAASRASYDARLAKHAAAVSVATDCAAGARSAPHPARSRSRRRKRATAGDDGRSVTAVGASTKCASRRQGECSSAGAPDETASKSAAPPSSDCASVGRDFLPRLHALLTQLPAESRRAMLAEDFSQAQRLALEAWLLESRRSGVGPSATTPGASSGAPAVHGDEVRGNGELERCSVLAVRPSASEGPSCSESSSDGDERTTDDEALALFALEDSGMDADCAPAEGTAPEELEDGVMDDACSAASGPGALSGARATACLAPGISKVVNSYRAEVFIFKLTVRTQCVRELGLALDHLVILTSMKQHALACEDVDVEVRLRRGLERALEEHGKLAEDLGLAFFIRFVQRYWVGPRSVVLPVCHSLSDVGRVLRRLSPCLHSGRGGRAGALFHMGPGELLERWRGVKDIYAELWEEAGTERSMSMARMARLEDEHRGHREKLMLSWERRHIMLEDHSLPLSFRMRMLNNTREGNRNRIPIRDRIPRRIRRLLRGWDLRVLGLRRAQLQAERVEAREIRRLRQERWRQSMRKDITMGELLGARFGCGLGEGR